MNDTALATVADLGAYYEWLNEGLPADDEYTGYSDDIESAIDAADDDDDDAE
jgi:hypothetical protein